MWLALNASDIVTTHLAMRLGALEANPIVAGLIGTAGETTTYSLRLLIVLVAAAVAATQRAHGVGYCFEFGNSGKQHAHLTKALWQPGFCHRGVRVRVGWILPD